MLRNHAGSPLPSRSQFISGATSRELPTCDIEACLVSAVFNRRRESCRRRASELLRCANNHPTPSNPRYGRGAHLGPGRLLLSVIDLFPCAKSCLQLSRSPLNPADSPASREAADAHLGNSTKPRFGSGISTSSRSRFSRAAAEQCCHKCRRA